MAFQLRERYVLVELHSLAVVARLVWNGSTHGMSHHALIVSARRAGPDVKRDLSVGRFLLRHAIMVSRSKRHRTCSGNGSNAAMILLEPVQPIRDGFTSVQT